MVLFTIIPSQRLYFLLSIAIAIAPLLAILINQQISIIATLTYDLILLILVVWDTLQVKAKRVKVERLPLQRLSVGRDNTVSFSIQTGDRPATIRLRDSYPDSFSVSRSILEASLPANSTEELKYTIRPDRRGKYEWGDIYLRQLGQFGLAWYSCQVANSCQVAVYPDLVGLRSLSIRLTLQSSGTMRQKRILGNGTEFAELREYNLGDDIRSIDWKATARRSRPIVRILEPEHEQTVIILLDRGRLMTAQVQGLKRFDWGLNSTLFLALAAINRGDRVGVAVFDRQITNWIPPERGQHQLSKLIETLTPIQPVLLEPDYMGACTSVINQQTRRALVVLITDLVDVTASAELLAAMVRLSPRYLPFCVTLRDPLVDKIAHTSTEDVNAAYARAVAIDLLSQRQIALAQLKQKGVLVLDAPADRISEQIVDRYLQLKVRNLL